MVLSLLSTSVLECSEYTLWITSMENVNEQVAFVEVYEDEDQWIWSQDHCH